MAARAVKVLKLQADIIDKERLSDSIIQVKHIVNIGVNMSANGFLVMDLVHQWVSRDISKLKADKQELTDIQLI